MSHETIPWLVNAEDAELGGLRIDLILYGDACQIGLERGRRFNGRQNGLAEVSANRTYRCRVGSESRRDVDTSVEFVGIGLAELHIKSRGRSGVNLRNCPSSFENGKSFY